MVTPPLSQADAQEAASRYLAAFQQMVTLSSAGPLVVIGIYQIISKSGNSQSDAASLPNLLSLVLSVAALLAFIASLTRAVNGLRRATELNIAGGSIFPQFFTELTVRFQESLYLFGFGIFMAFVLLLFPV